VERTTSENATKWITMTIAGGTLNASIDSCVLKDNSNSGLEVAGGTVSISNSVVTSNAINGILAAGSSGSVINVNHCVVTNNGTGINASTSSTIVRINDNDVTDNGVGVNNDGPM